MIHIAWGIIIASGKTEQLSAGPDIAFLPATDNPVISYSLMAFEKCSDIDGVVVVVDKDKLDVVAGMIKLYGFTKVRRVVAGTTQRYGSLQNGLKALDDSVTVVCAHNVSRPCVKPELITEVVKAAKRYGTGVAAVKIEDAVKEVEKGQKSAKPLDRTKLWTTQTPQAFRREPFEEGLETANKKKLVMDDDSDAWLAAKKDIHLVPSTTTNMKIRTADDLVVVSSLLRVI